MARRGFTLIEMLLATVLAALLLGGVLTVTAAMSKDSARTTTLPEPARSPIVRLLEWDLTNAATMQPSDDGQSLTLVGNGALDPRTMSPDGRLARVVYRIDPRIRALTREQRYLDDDIRPEPWVELLGTGVKRLDVSANIESDLKIPNHLSISIERDSGDVVAEVRAR